MRREPTAFHDRVFDVVIVGGGITGACLAHDATLRGLSVALIERGDFGAATSAASSKLLHGGIRYLQQGRFDKVRESARERDCFQVIAPHLMHWVPFLIPTQPGLIRGRWLLQCGTWFYERLTMGAERRANDEAQRHPFAKYCSRAELARLVPELGVRDDVTGAQVLYESHLHSTERMSLAFLKSAVAGGAVVANYMTADKILRSQGRVEGVTVIDSLDGDRFDLLAKMVINAAGPWLTDLNERSDLGRLTVPISGFSKGTHIVTRQIVDRFALALPTRRKANTVFNRGGRHVFVIPWRNHSLIGTSDRPYTGTLDDVRPTETDIADLLGDVTEALPGVGLTRSDVFHAFAGLYPLTARDLRPDVYQGIGDYQIVDHRREGIQGVVSVLGAKYTTARTLAERATNLVCKRLGRGTIPCRTSWTPLVGGDIDDLTQFTQDAVERYAESMKKCTVEHLVRHYGTEIDAVVAGVSSERQERSLVTQLTPARESIGAEVRFAVEEEMAVALSDVVFRRTGLGTVGDPGESALRHCAEIMKMYLGWSDEHTTEEVQRTQALFKVNMP